MRLHDNCTYCDQPATRRVHVRSAALEFTLVAYLPLAMMSFLVCAVHASAPDRLYFPGGQDFGGWVHAAVSPVDVTDYFEATRAAA